MESFFGRLKTDILDLVALCRWFGFASDLVDGYLDAYNTRHYQYSLAGLTPAEFYQYAATGIYPLDSYFGVPASVMMTPDDLSKVRRIYADGEAKKRREASRKKREEKRMVDPRGIMDRDEALLKRMISDWETQEGRARTQISHLKDILEMVKGAKEFLKTLTEEKVSELKEPLNWRKYEELGYVFLMNELF